MTKKRGFTEFNARGNKTAEILLYDEIGGGMFGGITARDFAKELRALGQIDHLKVRINSDGGSVFDGITIYNTLLDHPARVAVDIDGIAASISSVIAMAAAPGALNIASNAFMMIHDPWGIFAGTASELRDQAGILDKVRGQLLDTYIQRTGEQSRADVDKYMTAETWFDAGEAAAAGLVDSISSDIAMAAAVDFDLSKYKRVPDNLKNINNTGLIDITGRENSASAAITSMTNRLKARNCQPKT